MSLLRVKPDVACVVYDAESACHVALKPGDEFDSTDPVVRQFPWAFAPDGKAPARERLRGVSVEQATAAPGERR